jgi:cytochrome P450
MKLITEMSIPFLPIDDPAFQKDPMPYVNDARLQHPWLAKFSSGYVVHGYQALKDLAFMDDQLEMGLDGIVDFYQAQGTPWAAFMKGMLNSSTGADHKRLRASIASAFTPRSANLARPLMRQIISGLLDEWIPRGKFDFAEFASYFPVTVLCGVMGVSAEPIPRIRAAIESHMASLTLNRDIIPEFMAAYELLWKFVDELVIEREQQIRKSSDNHDIGLLDSLIATTHAGNMSNTELRYMPLVLLIGGYDTSKNMLTLTVHMLLQHPDYWARCAEDMTFCSKVIEEMLRHTTISNVFRNVKEEFDYQGHRFPKDILVIFATPLANRDPTVYPEPMQFDPERVTPEQHRHIAFGRGAHICPGQFLARSQLQEGLHLITQRIPHPRLAGEIGWRPFLGAWGLSTLPFAVG